MTVELATLLVSIVLIGLFLLLLSILAIDTKHFNVMYKASMILTIGGAMIMAFSVVYQLLSAIVRIGS